jgi:hypothetical protein
MISVPHLGEGRMLPNTNDGQYITQIESKMMMMSMGIKKLEGLRFDSNQPQFNPLGWSFVNRLGDEAQHYVLLPQNVDHGINHGSIVFTGCTNIGDIHELQPIITATQTFLLPLACSSFLLVPDPLGRCAMWFVNSFQYSNNRLDICNKNKNQGQ